MTYFITNKQRLEMGGCTDFLEFFPGKRKENSSFWNKKSILINEDVFDEIGLGSYFDQYLEDFDFYGFTEVSEEQWNKLVKNSNMLSKEVQCSIQEIDQWAQIVFEESDVFTIIGI